MTVEVPESYTAVFAPMPIALTNVVSDSSGVTLSWNYLAWAGTYRIYRGLPDVPSTAVLLAELPNSEAIT